MKILFNKIFKIIKIRVAACAQSNYAAAPGDTVSISLGIEKLKTNARWMKNSMEEPLTYFNQNFNKYWMVMVLPIQLRG